MEKSNFKPKEFLQSFGRRKSRKLLITKQNLLEDSLPDYLIDLSQPVLAGQKFWLEIGFGGGEHLAGRALANPEITMLGCEPFYDGIASMLGHIKREGIKNIRIFNDDARLLLKALPDKSLERVFILFPDPWPKLRHQKRRIVNQQTLDLLARVMCEGGELLLATDHVDYGVWMLEHLQADPRFIWQAQEPEDWQNPPAGWVETRYQVKTTLEGRKPMFLRYVFQGN